MKISTLLPSLKISCYKKTILVNKTMFLGSQSIYPWRKFLILLRTNDKVIGMATGPQVTFELHQSRGN